MSDETAPKWTIQTGDGALLPEELRAFVDAWLGKRAAVRCALWFSRRGTWRRWIGRPAAAYAAGRTGEAGKTKDRAFRRARLLSAAPERVVASLLCRANARR